MRIRFTLQLLVCFCFVLNASAQEFTLKGVTSKKNTPERVGQVMIKDLKTNTTIMSDDLGWFTIKTNVGDTLLFTKEKYTPQKIEVLNNSDMPVYLQPQIVLAEVKITGQTKRQEVNEIMGDYRKQGTFYNGKPPITSFVTNPLTGIYELFGKTPNRAKRFAQFSQGEIEQAEVNRRYNVAFVRQVTKLTSDTLAQRFMNYYTPTFEDLKGWNDYDLIKHTQKSFEYYNSSSEKDQLELLNSPTFIKSDSSKLSKPGSH